MIEFTAKLADIPIHISALYPETQVFLRKYLCEEPAVFSVQIQDEDIDYEREKSVQESMITGCKPVTYPSPYLETLAVYRKIAEEMLDRDVLLFHGSAIAVDGEVYLFTAKSGVGKSTHVRLWREYFGSRAVMVNDDKPLLKMTEDGVMVYGTPWDGKHRLSNPIALPLKALISLGRDQYNHVEPTDAKTIFPILLQQSYTSQDPIRMTKVLSMLGHMGSHVALYRLGCNMEPDAARVAYEGMQRKDEEK